MKYILKYEQMAFMLPYQEQIQRELIAGKMGQDTPWLDQFIESPEYKRIFGTMIWDEVLDRFEDTPGYDWELRQKLHEQLQDDLKHGRVTIKHKPVPQKRAEKSDLQLTPNLKPLRDYMLWEDQVNKPLD